MPKLSQEEWDRRAKAAGFTWLEAVKDSDTKTKAKCSRCGNVWSPRPGNAKRGVGCPRCASRERGLRQRIGQEEWDRRAEAVGLEWLEQVEKASTRVRARCLAKGHEVTPRPAAVAAGHGCRYCRYDKSRQRNRVTQEEWDRRGRAIGIEWLEPVKDSKSKAKARCLKCSFEWEGTVGNTCRGKGCLRCSGRVLSQEDWDARASQKSLRWLSPVENSTTRTPIQCIECQHRWDMLPSTISSTSGCPNCRKPSKRRPRRDAGVQRLSQEEWDRRAAKCGYRWLEPVKNSSTKTLAECLTCGHTWSPTPSNASNGAGCPKCSQERASSKWRITQEEWDRRAAEVGIAWDESVAAARKKTRFHCLECSHEGAMLPRHVTQGHGCPQCAKKQMGAYRKRPQQEWDRRAALLGLRWLQPVEKSDKRAKIKCLSCEREWMTKPNAVYSGNGCPECAVGGFKPDQPAVVYLLVREDGVAQVGITGQGRPMKERMLKHERNGYRLVRTWSFDIGAEARDVEQATVRRFRTDDNLLPADREGHDGWTETVHTENIALPEIARRISELADATSSYLPDAPRTRRR